MREYGRMWLAELGGEQELAHRHAQTVGHPQRGTPEMAALRGECEDRLVRRMGLQRYGRTFRSAVLSDARSLVSWGAHGGPVPEE